MVKGKEKFALWLTPEAKAMVEDTYQTDLCDSRSQYIEKAIRFYTAYLHAERADEFLPAVLSGVLEGHLGTLGDRVGRLLFKLSVEEAMVMHLFAAVYDVSQEDLEKLRIRCEADARKTNGMISFEEILAYQKESW